MSYSPRARLAARFVEDGGHERYAEALAIVLDAAAEADDG